MKIKVMIIVAAKGLSGKRVLFSEKLKLLVIFPLKIVLADHARRIDRGDVKF